MNGISGRILPILFAVLLLSGCNKAGNELESTSAYTDQSPEYYVSDSPSDQSDRSLTSIAEKRLSEIIDDMPNSEAYYGTEEAIDRWTKLFSLDGREDKDKIITKSYPLEELAAYFDYNDATPNFKTRIESLDKEYPIECLRLSDDMPDYCIYKLDDGGYLYVFFDENYGVMNIYAIEKPLNSNDFAALNIGDTLADVESIDTGLKLLNSVNSHNFYFGSSGHLLTDGYIVIEYNKNEENISLSEIEKITYYSKKDKAPFNILESDYPKE